MTEITTYKFGDEFSVEIKGHSGYADIGNDIVCASVSVLIQTLMVHMELVADYYKTHISNGYAWLYGKGTLAMLSYDTMMTGFRLIAEAYPEYVSLKDGCALIKKPSMV